MNKSFIRNILMLITICLITCTFSCTNPSSESSGGSSSSKTPPAPVENYTITFKANNSSATGSTASITAAANTTVTLTKNGFVLEGYNFTGWNTAANGSGTSYVNGASIKLTQNLILYAQWSKQIQDVYYTITFNSNNQAATGTTASIREKAGTTVTLTANGYSLTDYKFIGWNTASNGSGIAYANGASVTLNEDLTLYAQWVLAMVPTYTISIMQVEHGTVTADQTVAPAGTEITLTVTPDELYALDAITVKDVENNIIQITVNPTNSNMYTFLLPEKNVSVTVSYRYIAHSITVTSVQNGSVEVNKTVAVPGDEITVTISPNQYYLIDSVIIKDSENNIIQTTQNQTNQNKYKFIMPEKNVSVLVNLRYVAHSVTISSVQNGNVVSNKDVAVEGETITLTLSPNNLYAVESISVKGANNSQINVTANQNNGNIYFFTMPDQNVIVYVTFANRVHSVTVSQTQNGTVSVNKTSAVDGDVITITATPNDLFAVDSVTIIDSNNIIVNYTSTQNSENTYKFVMPTENVTISVTFKYIAHTVTISSTQNGTITANKNVATAGQSVKITLNPNQYYELDSITVKDSNNDSILLTGSNNSYIFTMPDSNVTISVTFKLISYKVSFVTDCSTQIPDQLIQRNGKASAVSVNDNAQCEGFLGWYKDIECTDNNRYDFNTAITQDVVLYAKWEKFNVNPDNIVSKINSLHYSCVLQGTGNFYGTTIGNVNTALQDLYTSNESLFVILDFSLASYISLADNSFNGCQNLKSIVFPNNLTTIGNYAFIGCTSLDTVIIPDSVVSIGRYAFEACAITDIAIPENVTSLGNNAFSSCENLSRVRLYAKEISGSVSNCFENCSKLTTIEIYDGVTIIPSCLFSGISNITDVSIPDTVKIIGAAAFMDCSSLSSIRLSNSLTTIESNAFWGCSSLSNVIFPESVTRIGWAAFYECCSLTDVSIPDGITVISRNAFKGCTSLKNVIMPNSVTKIEQYAFSGCISLENITIPTSVNTIGEYAFSSCSSLSSITIPEGVTSIVCVVSYCSSLQSVTIPESLTSIGTGSFSGCEKLETAYFEGQNKKWKVKRNSNFETITVSDNPQENAVLLKKTYKLYEWTKKE